MLAGCEIASGPASCAERVEELRTAVAAQRARHLYDFGDPWGFGLIEALLLGEGGYWSIDRVTATGDEAEAVVVVRTQYRADETSRLPRGAAIEYLARPLGQVVVLVKGTTGPGALRWQLDEVQLRSRWKRTAGGDWRLVALEPIPESAKFSQVTWRPQ
jgi:hypothetical protein